MSYQVKPTAEAIERWNTELADEIAAGDVDALDENYVLEAHIPEDQWDAARERIAVYNAMVQDEDADEEPLVFRLMFGEAILPVELTEEAAA